MHVFISKATEICFLYFSVSYSRQFSCCWRGSDMSWDWRLSEENGSVAAVRYVEIMSMLFYLNQSLGIEQIGKKNTAILLNCNSLPSLCSSVSCCWYHYGVTSKTKHYTHTETNTPTNILLVQSFLVDPVKGFHRLSGISVHQKRQLVTEINLTKLFSVSIVWECWNFGTLERAHLFSW